MTKKIIVARVEVLAGKEADFMALTPTLIKASQAEAGCLVYELYQSPIKPTEFLVYEEYLDDKAFEFHGNTDHFQTFAKNVQPLLAKALDIQTF